MTIKRLKELIKDLPDDTRIFADDGSRGMFSDNNEFLTFVAYKNMCVLQTREDFDVVEELNEWLNYANEFDMNEQDFWIEFVEAGFKPEDFHDKEREKWAYDNLRNYGLI